MEIKDLLDFGPFQADLRRRVLLRDHQPVSLPAKAFDVLVLLLRNAGTTVSKEDILKTVWPDTFVEEGNLTQTIFLLRKALEDSDNQPYIVTVPRQGYRFVGPVTPGAAVAANSIQPDELLPAPWKRYRWHVLAVVALAGVAGVVATSIVAVSYYNPASLPNPSGTVATSVAAVSYYNPAPVPSGDGTVAASVAAVSYLNPEAVPSSQSTEQPLSVSALDSGPANSDDTVASATIAISVANGPRLSSTRWPTCGSAILSQ